MNNLDFKVIITRFLTHCLILCLAIGVLEKFAFHYDIDIQSILVRAAGFAAVITIYQTFIKK